jgi:hypothetical protein
MGVGRAKRPMREIDSTRSSGVDDQIESILKKVQAAGGEIISDEVTPLYTEIGVEEFEIGENRIIEFGVNGKDFRLTQKKEFASIQGHGRTKHLEELDSPRSSLSLKLKLDYKNEWQNIDLEMLG